MLKFYLKNVDREILNCFYIQEGPMQIPSVSNTANLIENISKLNDMVRNVSDKQMDMANKMMKVNVIQNVEGKGENIDVTA